jgi:hypothetical protein
MLLLLLSLSCLRLSKIMRALPLVSVSIYSVPLQRILHGENLSLTAVLMLDSHAG